MICKNCGYGMEDNSLYCNKCGAGNGAVNKGKGKKVYLLIAILAIALGISLIMLSFKGKEAGQMYFKTPEAAAEYFVKCINNKDYEGAIRAFATEEKAKNYDFMAHMEYMKYFSLVYITSPEYEEYEYINTLSYEYNAANSIKKFVFGFNYINEERNLPYIMVEDRKEASKIYKAFDPEKSKIKLKRLDYASPETQDSYDYNKTIEKIGEIYGFTDMEEYYALYEYEDEYYLGGFMFVKYEKGWQIDDLYSRIGTGSQTTITPIDEEEYYDLKDE